jgi:hypothetical protein
MAQAETVIDKMLFGISPMFQTRMALFIFIQSSRISISLSENEE